MTKVVLDLHDWTPVHNCFDVLLKLKAHFPKFKVSLFAIPYDLPMDYGPYLNRKQLVEEAKKHLDWIQLIPHGLVHDRREARKWDYELFKHKIFPEIVAGFNIDGLPFEKGFVAPHWDWNDGVVKYLDEIGWWGAVLREDTMKKTRRFYRYTHLLNEPFWESNLPVLKLHGHTYGTKNDVGKCLDNLFKLPKDTDFYFVTDFIETQ